MNEELGYEAQVAPELIPMLRPMADAQPHPDNARDHRIEKIAQSLTRFGQRSLIIVQASTGYIVKGNGTYAAANLLGWDHMAMSLQDMEDDTALEYLFADNRTSDLATYKREKLLAGLGRLAEGPGILDTLWEVDELEDLREEFTPITEMPDKGTAQDTGPTVEDEQDAAVEKLPGKKLHEMPLLLNNEDYAEFTGWVSSLQKEWGVSGVTDTIIMAVKYAVEKVAENAEPEPAEDVQVAPTPITTPQVPDDHLDEDFPV